MDYIEQTGAQNPVAMGSILVELEKSILKNLYLYGKGDWWLVAISQSAPITSNTLALLGQIDRYRVRRQFSGANSHICDAQMKDRVLWYLIPLIVLSGCVIPVSIFFMLDASWFMIFVPITMLMFFGNIILNIAEQHTRITITAFIVTVIFNFVAVFLNFL